MLLVSGNVDLTSSAFIPNLSYLYDEGYNDGNEAPTVVSNYLYDLAIIKYGVTSGTPDISNPSFNTSAPYFTSGFSKTYTTLGPTINQQNSIESYLSAHSNINQGNNLFLLDFSKSGGLSVSRYRYVGFSNISFGLKVYILNSNNDVSFLSSADNYLTAFNSLDLKELANGFDVVRLGVVASNIDSLNFTINCDTSYNNGYKDGYENGSSDGFTDGFNSASSNNKENYDKGYQDGLNASDDKSYDKGYQDGLNASNFVGDSLLSIADIPIKIVSSFLNFEIFGFNLLALFTGLLTLGIFIFVIKKFFK